MLLANRYEIIRTLGHGAGGAVFVVQDQLSTTRPLALKTIRGNDELVTASLRREFQVLAALRHPRLAQVYDFGKVRAEESGGPATFFTREFLTGEPLGTVAAGRSWEEIVRAAIGVCRALAPLHHCGLVHGDLKPDNVIVSPAGQVRLIDFGLVRAVGESGEWPAGTLPYVAPEVLRGQAADPRSDLYAMGVMLFELLTGNPPFAGTPTQIITAHLETDPPLLVESDLVDRIEGLPLHALGEVVGRLLEKDPTARYPSVGELEAALRSTVAEPQLPEKEDRLWAITPGLVGRESTLEALEELFLPRGQRAADAPPLVVLQGGPGTGKTTLLRQLKWRAQLQGVRVVEVACGQAPLPLWPVPQLARHLTLLAGTTDVQPEEESDLTERAAAAGRSVARREPLLVLVEDLHLASPEARGALRSFAHEVAAEGTFLVVMSYCPSHAAPEVPTDLGEHRLVQLTPLGLAEVQRLVTLQLGRHDEDLGRELHRWTEGNPLFCLELLRAVGERGGVSGGGLEALGVPRRLEEFWRGRLAEVPPAQRLVVAAVALWGPAVEPATVARVTRFSEEAVSRDVDLLVDQGLLLSLASGTVALAHGGLGAAAREALADSELTTLHEGVAAALHELGGSPAERAYHLLRAGPRHQPEAQVLAVAAACELMRCGAERAAADLLRTALAAWRGPGAERALLLFAEALHGAGEYDEAAQLLRQQLTEPREGDQRVGGLSLLGRVLAARGEHGEAREAWETALSVTDDPGHRARLRRDLGRMLMKQGLFPEAEEVTRAALPDVQAADPLRADLLCTLGLIADYRGAPEQAMTCYEEALSLARRQGARRQEATVLTHLGIAHQREGRYDSALEAYTTSLSLAREAGDVGSMAILHGNLGGLAHLKNDYLLALEHYQAALRLAQRVGREATAAAARTNSGLLHLFLGEYEHARNALEAALVTAEKLGSRQLTAQAMAHLGELAGRLQQHDLAVQRFTEARQSYSAAGQLREACEVGLDLALALLRRGTTVDRDQAASILEQASATIGEQGWDALVPRAAWAQACLAEAREEEDRALALFQQAAEQAQERSDGETEWQALVGGAQVLLRRGAPLAARSKLQRALELLEQVSATLPRELRTSFWQDPQRQQARAFFEQLGAGPRVGRGATPTEAGGNTTEMLFRLLEINKRINSDPDLPRLLTRIIDSAIEFTDAERGFLLLANDSGQLEMVTARDFGQGTPDDAHVQFSRSIAETVLVDGEPVITLNAMADHRFNEYLSVHQLRLQSVLCIPIRARGRAIGVLYMENRLRHGEFGEPDQRILLAFADQVAIALENSRLMAELTRRQQELERAKSEIEKLCEERGRQLNRRTAQLAAVRRDLRQAMDQIQGRVGFLGIVGQSEPMQHVFAILDRIRHTDVPVVIAGESGTGKEMVARAIHVGGGRAKKPFVAINCGAVPETLLESELFGHVRGAFTGADRDKKGLLLSAEGGTVLLDEIADTPAKMQLDLLRVLQEKKVRPVGSERDLSLDVRVLAASNRPLRDLIQRGAFREDLYYRLNVVEVVLPPLRERSDDIPLLVDHFLKQLALRFKAAKKAITRDALRALMAYPWPGNVRQLEHVLTNAWVMCDGDTIDQPDLTLESVPPRECPPPQRPSALPATYEDQKEQEKQAILQALQQVGWNRSKAAELLNMPRRTFYRRLKIYGIQ